MISRYSDDTPKHFGIQAYHGMKTCLSVGLILHTGVICAEFFHYRLYGAARLAPERPEIHHHRTRILFYALEEIILQ